MALSSLVRRASSSIFSFSLLKLENRFASSAQFFPFTRFSTTATANEIASTIETFNSSKPFSNEFVLKDGPNKGTVTLVRKSQDGIIKIDVKAYQNPVDYYYFHAYIFPEVYGLRHVHLGEFSSHPDVELDDTMVDVVPCLHLLVKIFYGDMYRKLLQFNVIVLIDHPDQFVIRDMYIRDDYGTESSMHRKDFVELLAKRGIELSTIRDDYGKESSMHGDAFVELLAKRGIERSTIRSVFDYLTRSKEANPYSWI